MGSFNMQCCVSHQVIGPRDPCRVVAVVAQRGYRTMKATNRAGTTFAVCPPRHNGIAPMADWAPASGFIEATYDDYGWTELKLSRHNHLVVASLIEAMLSRTPDCVEFDSDYIEGTPEPADIRQQFNLKELLAKEAPHYPEATVQQYAKVWEELQKAAQQGLLYMADYSGTLVNLQFALISEFAYLELIKEAEGQKNYRDEPLDRMTRVLGFKKEGEELAQLHAKNEGLKRYAVTNAIREGLTRGIQGLHPITWPYFDDVNNCAEKLASGGDVSQDFLLPLKDMLDSVYAFTCMEAFNISLTPPVYTGQDYENEQGAAYAKFVTRVSKAVARQNKKKYL